MENIKIKSVALNKETTKAKVKREGFNAYFDIVYQDGANKVEKTKVAYLQEDKSYTMIMPFGLVRIEKNGKDYVGSLKEKKERKQSSPKKKEDKKATKENKKVEKKEPEKKKEDKKAKVVEKKEVKKEKKQPKEKHSFVETAKESIFG